MKISAIEVEVGDNAKKDIRLSVNGALLKILDDNGDVVTIPLADWSAIVEAVSLIMPSDSLISTMNSQSRGISFGLIMVSG